MWQLIFLPGIGEEFPYLRTLRISGDSVKFVERRSFTNMNQLRELQMSNMPIELLPADLLIDLPNLEIVKMVDFKIEKIPEKIFVNQRKLKELNLRFNKLTVLEKDLFEFNLKLEKVYLTGNKLEQVFVDFTKLTAIKLIDLIGNDCTSQSYDEHDSDGIHYFQNVIISCCGAKASASARIRNGCSSREEIASRGNNNRENMFA